MKVTFFRSLLKLGRLAIFLLVIIAFLYSQQFNSLLFFPSIVVSLMVALPTLYLFVEYYYFNKGKVFEIDDTGIRIESDISKEFIPTANISKMIVYKSATMEKGNFPMTPIEIFYYARVFTDDQRQIILTCLLNPGFDRSLENLKNIPTEVRRQIFSSIIFP